MRRLLLAATMACVFPATAGAVTIHATPSTFGQSWTAARGGDTILLAAGSYGSWSPTTKGSMVTLQPEDGASVSMAGAYFSESSYITLRGVRFTSGVVLDNNTHHVTLDAGTFDNLAPALFEGRLSINRGAHDNVVSNSHFGGNAGCSDGVFVGSATANTIGPGNEFTGIKQGGCSAHTDSVQLYSGPQTRIVGNYFHDSDTHLMAPDGSTGVVVTDNVMVGGGYRPAVQFGHHNGSQFVHNTTRNIDVNFYVAGADSSPNRNMIVRDNLVLGGSLNGSGCQACTVDHNGTTGTFVGGANPTTYAGHELTASSPGKGAASDGADQGVRFSGIPTPPPPPPPTPPPPSCDDQCVAQLKADLDAATNLADAYKARALAAEAKLDQIHTLSAP